MPQSIREYIDDLNNEKFRSFIIHSNDEMRSNNFVKEVAFKLKGKFIDLRQLFENDPILYKALDSFNTSKLNELLKKEANHEKLVFVSNIAFLWDTWNDSEKANFLTLVDKQWNSFFKETKATLVFNLPPDHILQSTTIKDTRGKSRIKEMNDFSAII